MKNKTWTYPVSATIKDADGNVKLNVVTQFYQTGIYIAIYDGNSSMPDQFGLEPKQMKKFMSGFRKENLTAECEDYTVQFGRDVTVTEEDGLYKQL